MDKPSSFDFGVNFNQSEGEIPLFSIPEELAPGVRGEAFTMLLKPHHGSIRLHCPGVTIKVYPRLVHTFKQRSAPFTMPETYIFARRKLTHLRRLVTSFEDDGIRLGPACEGFRIEVTFRDVQFETAMAIFESKWNTLDKVAKNALGMSGEDYFVRYVETVQPSDYLAQIDRMLEFVTSQKLFRKRNGLKLDECDRKRFIDLYRSVGHFDIHWRRMELIYEAADWVDAENDGETPQPSTPEAISPELRAEMGDAPSPPPPRQCSPNPPPGGQMKRRRGGNRRIGAGEYDSVGPNPPPRKRARPPPRNMGVSWGDSLDRLEEIEQGIILLPYPDSVAPQRKRRPGGMVYRSTAGGRIGGFDSVAHAAKAIDKACPRGKVDRASDRGDWRQFVAKKNLV